MILGPAHPLRGGIADSTEALSRNLNEAGIQTIIVSYSLQYPSILFPGKTQYTTDPEPENIEIQTMINSMNPVSWWRVARYINRQVPDLVVVRFWIPFLGLCLGTILRMLHRDIKIIAVCDNIIPHEHRPGDRQLTRYFVSACHGFLTFSNKVAEELKEFTDKPVNWHPLPMDTKFPPKLDKDLALRTLGLSPKRHYLLFFGLVRDYKGLDLLLEALAEPAVKNMPVTLLVAGEFYSDKKKYTDLIHDLKLEDRVIIRDEFIPLAEIGLYFSAVDLVSQTYKTASQSGVTQIAYFYDCPILVTDVGGLSETVDHGEVGYVVPPVPGEIAAALASFFIEDKYQTFSDKVKVKKEKFTWDNFRINLIDLYHTLN